MNFHPGRIEFRTSYEETLRAAYKARQARWAAAARKVKQIETSKLALESDLVQQNAHTINWRAYKAIWEAREAARRSGAQFSTGSPCQDYIRSRCEELGFTYEQITGPSRKKDLIAAKHLIIWEVRNKWPDQSLPWIGKQFGGMDHTSVYSALLKHGYEPGARNRPSKDVITEMKRMRKAGVSEVEIAKAVGCCLDTVKLHTNKDYQSTYKQKLARKREATKKAKAKLREARGKR